MCMLLLLIEILNYMFIEAMVGEGEGEGEVEGEGEGDV